MIISQAGSVFALLSTLFSCPPATNAAAGASKVTTVAVPGGGKPVVAKTDKEGAIHLLYESKNGPEYVKSSDGGLTFSPPISVVGDGPRTEGLEYSAWDMALGKGGRVHVAMGTNAWKLKLPVEEWGFFYASLDPGASPSSRLAELRMARPPMCWRPASMTGGSVESSTRGTLACVAKRRAISSMSTVPSRPP